MDRYREKILPLVILITMGFFMSAPIVAVSDNSSIDYLVIIPSLRIGATAIGGWVEGKFMPQYDLEGSVALEHGSITPFLWGLTGLRQFSGQVIMKIAENGSLVTNVNLNLSSIKLQQPIVGYQEIIWGYRPWGVPPGHPILNKPFKVPVKIAELPRVLLYTRYDVIDYNTAIDLSYDLWIYHNDLIRQPERGDYEVMIWLYYDGTSLAGWATLVGEIRVPITINGEIKNSTWEVWIKENHGWGWTYVALLLKDKIRSGDVIIDLYELLKELDKILRVGFNRTLINNYMIGIEFGMEISYKDLIDVSWRLDRYMIIAINKTVDSYVALATANEIVKNLSMKIVTVTLTRSITEIKEVIRNTTVTLEKPTVEPISIILTGLVFLIIGVAIGSLISRKIRI